MKLLLCPQGHIAVGVKNLLIYIDRASDEKRGYALVRDDIAADLLTKPGYEVVDPKSYPRDIKVLYVKVRKTLGQESLDDFINGVESAIIRNDTDSTPETGVSIPTPVFIPTIWTTADSSNFPVTIIYNDTQGNPNSFVFTQDFTIRPCLLCRIKYWIRNRVFRKGLKSS